MLGTLTVKPICAKLTFDTEIFGRMDPYVKLYIGSQYYKTRSATDMGKNPNWNESFTFRIGMEKQLQFEIYDKDWGKDDYIGWGKIDLSQICSQRNRSDWFPVFWGKKHKKNKSAGQIMISFEYVPQMNQMPMNHFPMQPQQINMMPQNKLPQMNQMPYQQQNPNWMIPPLPQISPQGYGMPQQGQRMPPQGYGIPFQGQKMQHKGQKMPPQGYRMPPQGQRIPPQGYGMPPQGQRIPPQGYGMPPQGFGISPQGYGMPPQGYGMPPQGYGMPPQGYGMPPQGYGMPHLGYGMSPGYGMHGNFTNMKMMKKLQKKMKKMKKYQIN